MITMQTSLLTSLAQVYTPPSYPKYWTPEHINANDFMTGSEVSLYDFTLSPSLYSFSKINFYHTHVIPLINFSNVWDYIDFAFLPEIYSIGTDHWRLISEISTNIAYKARGILFNQTTVTAGNFQRHKTFLVDSLVSDLFYIINFFVANKSRQSSEYITIAKYELAELILPLWQTNNPSDTIMSEVLTMAKNKTAPDSEIIGYRELLKNNYISNFERLIYSIGAGVRTISNQGYNYGFVLYATQYVKLERNPILKNQYQDILFDYLENLFM